MLAGQDVSSQLVLSAAKQPPAVVPAIQTLTLYDSNSEGTLYPQIHFGHGVLSQPNQSG